MVLALLVAGQTRWLGRDRRFATVAFAVHIAVAAAWSLAILAIGAAHVSAIEITYTPVKVERTVLALYDGRAEKSPSETRIHRFAEMVLNHLGFVVAYQDVSKPLPPPDTLPAHRAVLTWFLEPMQDPGLVGEWLVGVTSNPRTKYVALGEVLPDEAGTFEGLRAKLLGKLGLEDGEDFVEVTFGSELATLDADMIGFERQLDKVLPPYPILHTTSDKTHVHLAILPPAGSSGEASSVVVTGPGGGYAEEAFTIFFEPNADRLAWILNPFRFFELAIGAGQFPIPDATTVAGRRMYFSHIDGDGWNNLSEIEAYHAQGLLSSEVILREAIAAYPDLPVTVGLIGCDVDPQYGAEPAAASVARSFFALPQVEVGSHTHTHPYDWSFFERYDRSGEVAKIEAYQRPEMSLRQRMSEQLHLIAGKPAPVTGSNKYIAGSDDLPRTYLKNPFDLGTEVKGGLTAAESLAPPGKRAKLYQWSGDTTPFEAAVKATRVAGVRNLNGGDSRLDREYPSVAYVPALSRPVGRERQIYAANSNENTYTNDWTGPYYGFFMLEETLRNTEHPRRLKPFNLYYHMYSGEKPSALAAIRHFLDLARGTDVVPVTASDYAAIADNFFDIEIERLDDATWAITGHRDLETVRFDHAQDLRLNVARSDGVLGSTRVNGSLYVTLDRARPRVIVSLAPPGVAPTGVAETATAQAVNAQPGGVPTGGEQSGAEQSRAERTGAERTGAEQTGGEQPSLAPLPEEGANSDKGSEPVVAAASVVAEHAPLLVDSRWRITALSGDGCNATMTAAGFGQGDMHFEAAPGRRFDVMVSRSGSKLTSVSAVADEAGRLGFSLAANAIEPVEVRLACHD